MRSLAGIILLLLTLSVLSQPCPPWDLEFTDQASIDNFQSMYPGCTEIPGDVLINGCDITNLDGLNVITLISGGLYIDSTSLCSLSGLDSLTYVGYRMRINYNQRLKSLEGLQNITLLGFYLEITANDSLLNILDLANITYIGGGITIAHNNSILDLKGLEGILMVEGDLLIYGNDELVSLSGLENIINIEGTLGVGYHHKLRSLNGFNNLSSIDGSIYIDKNASLESIEDLMGVTYINGNIHFWDNDTLQNLSGLDNISVSSIEELKIYHNDMLSDCAVKSICDFIANPGGYLSISWNATGCKDEEEVEEACETVTLSEPLISEEIRLYPNPAGDVININPGQLTVESVAIYTLLGEKVHESVKDPGLIDITSLSAGLYVVEVNLGAWKIKRKLAVQ